jgi:hypothetical protein
VFGWFALGLGALAWLVAVQSPRRVGYEARLENLYLLTAFGILVAIGVGMGIYAVRLHRKAWVAWVSLVVNAGFLAAVFECLARLL